MFRGSAFLIWLVCVGISAILIAYFLRESSFISFKKEGFAIHTCPSGTNSFITNEGETLCCNGDVVDGLCTGNLRCTLSPKSKYGVPTCSDLLASESAAAGANKCPATMPYYFASLNGSLRGCSASQSIPNGTEPSDPNQPQCILYPTEALDRVKLDSCYNVLQNAKNAEKCSAAQATAALPACAAAAKSAVSAANNCPPPPACPTVQAPKPPTNIQIVDASYGLNCNPALKGNRTQLFKTLTAGKSSLNYTYDYRQTGGDPASGCAKTLVINYNCGGANKVFTAPAEAGINGKVALTCP